MNKYTGILAAALAIGGAGSCESHPSKPEAEQGKINPHEMIVLDMINNGKMIVHECISETSLRDSLDYTETANHIKFEKNDQKFYGSRFILRLGDGQILKVEENSSYCRSGVAPSVFDEKKTDGGETDKQPK